MTSPSYRPLAGILWMLVSGLCFVVQTAVVRYIGPEVNAVQGGFIRYAWSVAFLLPSLFALKGLTLSAGVWGLVGLRGVMQAIGIACWYYAIARLTVSEVTAISYLNPVLVTVGGVLFFAEKLALRRVLAIVAALLGALVILRPGLRELQIAHVAQLGTAVFLAASYLLAKRLASDLAPAMVVALMSLTTALCMAPFAWLFWQPISLVEVGLLGLVAVFATAGHYTMMRAFAAAPMAVIQPVTFLQLLWATLLGYFAFSEAVDPYVILGGAIIIASVSYIAWREAQLKRAATVEAALKV